MHSTPSPLLLAAGLALASSVSFAQSYVGTADFGSPSALDSWAFQYSLGGTAAGTWVVQDGVLNYTSAAGNTSRVVTWNGSANTSYTENWTVSVDVSNLTTPAAGFTYVGLQVFSANADLGFFNLGAYRSATASISSDVLFEKGRTTNGNAATYSFRSYTNGVGVPDLSDLRFFASFDATSKDVTLSYSFDGGSTTADSAVFNPISGSNATDWVNNLSDGAWYAAPTDGFSFRLIGLSTADAISVGQLTLDNFSVSAVPEPSTYAALAGAAFLGFAIWRRRSARASVATQPTV